MTIYMNFIPAVNIYDGLHQWIETKLNENMNLTIARKRHKKKMTKTILATFPIT